MSLLKHLNSLFSYRQESGAREDVATLLMAAREDEALRAEIENLLQMPDADRGALIQTAVEEMKLKSESATARAAFAMLGTPEGATAAREALRA